MSFSDKTVAELKKIARISGIDIGDAKKKAEILKIFKDNNFTEQDYLNSINSIDGGNVEKKEDSIKVTDHTKSEVILTTIYPQAAYLVKGILFTKDEPYKVVDRQIAEEILSRSSHRIREATPKEVSAFYSGE